MPALVDTHVLINVSRNNQSAILWMDRLASDWTLAARTALELISGAKNQREVDLSDPLIEAYQTVLVTEAIGKRAYDLLKSCAKSDGLRSFDALIAATTIEKRLTLVTRKHKHCRMISG